MVELEYVASGIGHLRILNSCVLESDETKSIVNKYIRALNGRHNHKFSMLFNAFTEKNLGHKIRDNYRESLHSIHADSGGLQIITRGKEITPALKDEVYRTQAEYSEIAMCFDEIPVEVTGTSSDRNDVSGRLFQRDRLEHYARETGKNIKRQIEVFLEEKTKSRPMLIAQGNCYDSYMLWTEYLLDEIPKEMQPAIAGVAMGAAALGTGLLEDIERAAYATELPFQMEEPYFHILGVGAIKRLLPFLMLIKNGYYKDNLKVSYDSTTHTAGASLGNYFLEKNITFERAFSDKYAVIYNDINKKFDLASKGIDLVKFYKLINENALFHTNDDKTMHLDNLNIFYENLMAFTMSSIDNFMQTINSCIKSEKRILDIAHKNKVLLEINSLRGVDSIEAFLEWKDNHGCNAMSKRVQSSDRDSLERFFG